MDNLKKLQYNLNNNIYVKLADRGIYEYMNYYNEYASLKHQKSYHDVVDSFDEDGYLRLQLHEFMNIYGEFMDTGVIEVFVDYDILIDKKDLKEIKND